MTKSRRQALLNIIDSLTEAEAEAALFDFSIWGRDEQQPPPGNWRNWLILAGRGWGKTRTGAEWVNAMAAENPKMRMALIGQTTHDVRSVMVLGESGIMACAPAYNMPAYKPSLRLLEWPNGAIAQTFTAEEPEGLRGFQFSAAWCDELAAWQYINANWDMLQFCLRLGDAQKTLITTTPKPIKILKELMADTDTVTVRGSTLDNAGNLPPDYIKSLLARYEGTTLGRQELYAEIVDNVDGALWTLARIAESRVKTPHEQLMGQLNRVVVAVDPAVSNTAGSDETGIIVAGVDAAKHAYILRDCTMRGAPEAWARKAVELYHYYRADRIVAEVNQGGDLVESVIRHISPDVPIRKVHASKGKRTRAEPVAALYEQGRVHHAGIFAGLENQMAEFTSDFEAKKMGYSPDRVDALVWAITDLIPFNIPTPQIRVL